MKRTVMEYLRDRFPSVFGKPAPPIIATEWGPVTESARLQCAVNMRLEPERRARIERMCVALMGGDEEKGLAESRRRYPEAYEDD